MIYKAAYYTTKVLPHIDVPAEQFFAYLNDKAKKEITREVGELVLSKEPITQIDKEDRILHRVRFCLLNENETRLAMRKLRNLHDFMWNNTQNQEYIKAIFFEIFGQKMFPNERTTENEG